MIYCIIFYKYMVYVCVDIELGVENYRFLKDLNL